MRRRLAVWSSLFLLLFDAKLPTTKRKAKENFNEKSLLKFDARQPLRPTLDS
jgi:hypothetical protein